MVEKSGLAAFSKRFVGAGHSEEGGGPVAKAQKAPYRALVGRAPLGGSGGIPPQKFFEIWMLKSAIWWNLGGS